MTDVHEGERTETPRARAKRLRKKYADLIARARGTDNANEKATCERLARELEERHPDVFRASGRSEGSPGPRRSAGATDSRAEANAIIFEKVPVRKTVLDVECFWELDLASVIAEAHGCLAIPVTRRAEDEDHLDIRILGLSADVYLVFEACEIEYERMEELMRSVPIRKRGALGRGARTAFMRQKAHGVWKTYEKVLTAEARAWRLAACFRFAEEAA